MPPFNLSVIFARDEVVNRPMLSTDNANRKKDHRPRSLLGAGSDHTTSPAHCVEMASVIQCWSTGSAD